MRTVRTARARQGFTVMELMLVLVTIGVMSALIAPAVGEVVANERARGAAVDVYRLATEAETRTTETATAHMLEFIASENNGLGTIAQYMGMNRSCTRTPWDQATGAPPTGFLSARQRLLMAEYNPTSRDNPGAGDGGRQVIRLQVDLGPAEAVQQLRICFQPNGTHYTSTTPPLPGAPAYPVLTAQTFPALFTVKRSVDGVQHGVDRQVIFPVSGGARIR